MVKVEVYLIFLRVLLFLLHDLGELVPVWLIGKSTSLSKQLNHLVYAVAKEFIVQSYVVAARAKLEVSQVCDYQEYICFHVILVEFDRSLQSFVGCFVVADGKGKLAPDAIHFGSISVI